MSPTPPTAEQVIEQMFRQEAGRMTVALARAFGLRNIELAEDIVQETLLKALEHWRYQPLPDNPKAWLYRAARNRALDVLRRGKYQERPAEEDTLARAGGAESLVDQVFLEGELQDSQLRMMFACCHPDLPTEAQLMLILKTLCGFNTREIARAFLQQEDAVAKRLYRARQKLADSGFSLELPPEAFAGQRLPTVLLALYLLFNEGYNATEATDFIREELCLEALRLAHLLTQYPATTRPEVFALLALMSFHSARFPARKGPDGQIVLLEQQDRALWDQPLISQGVAYLNLAVPAEQLTEYHLEAAIAATHSTAPSFAATDWPQLLQYYDVLYNLKPTPLVALNRAVVIAKVHGPAQAIPLIEALPGWERHHLFLSVLAQLHKEAGEQAKANDLLHKAINLCPSPRERDLLEKKLVDWGWDS